MPIPRNPDEKHALGLAAAPQPLQGNHRGFEQLITAGELGRRGAGAGGERVGQGVHDRSLSEDRRSYVMFSEVIKFR